MTAMREQPDEMVEASPDCPERVFAPIIAAPIEPGTTRFGESNPCRSARPRPTTWGRGTEPRPPGQTLIKQFSLCVRIHISFNSPDGWCV